ncbi:MAG: cation transporter [Breznakibacter sp.]
MKPFIIIIIAALAFAGLSANAQISNNTTSPKTETIRVMGNCGMCKARIEKAAKTDGVSQAQWDSKTKLLTLVYDPSKTNVEIIGKKVAAAGHDTDKAKADDKAYSQLPGCCKYR